jgi:hypothetical protein
MMQDSSKLQTFSLLGGPLHQISCRIHLVRRGNNTVLTGFAIGLVLWLVLVGLAAAQGVAGQLFSLSLIGGHTRLLLVIPLLFFAETILEPRMNTFLQTMVRSGIIPSSEIPALQSDVERIGRWRDSWLPEALFLLLAVAFFWIAPQMPLYGTTSVFDQSSAPGGTTLAATWYVVVCLTVFRFLMLRWLWRIGLWCYLLWRLTKLDLQLLPTHPDGVAGLGYLEVVHTHFTPVIMALSVIQAASLAEDIVVGAAPFEAIYPSIALILVVNAALFVGPLFILAPRLWACRIKGLSDYMEFASRYVSDFDRKWLINTGGQEPLLGTSDLQSLADLGNSIKAVRDMRWAPLSLRLIKDMVLAALLPLVPLLLLQFPLNTLIQTFFARLTGL